MDRLKKLLSHDRFFQIFLVFLLLQLLVKIAVILSFDDRGFEPDSYQHFLQVRTVLEDFPHNLWMGLDVWAKPLYVYPFALLVTLTGVDKLIVIQLANALISTATVTITFAIARKLFSSQIALVSTILLASSLLFFKSSVSDLTEPIFALFLTLALYSVVTERFKTATILFSIAVLGRIEGLFFLGIYGLWLSHLLTDRTQSVRGILTQDEATKTVDRLPRSTSGSRSDTQKYNYYSVILTLSSTKWRNRTNAQLSSVIPDLIRNLTSAKLVRTMLTHMLIAALPLAIWIAFGYSHYHDLSFLPGGYVSATDVYGQGHMLFYPYKFLTQEFAISVLFAVSAIIYLVHNLRHNRLVSKLYERFRIKSGMTGANAVFLRYSRFNILLLTFSVGFIATQVITWSTGTLGSAGLMRYFVGIMPMMAIFSGLALTWLRESLAFKSKNAFALLASGLIIVSATLTGLYATDTLNNGQPWLYDTSDYKLAGAWIADNIDADTTVYYDRPEVIYYSDRNLQNSNMGFGSRNGDIVIWCKSWNKQDTRPRGVLLLEIGDVEVYKI